MFQEYFEDKKNLRKNQYSFLTDTSQPELQLYLELRLTFSGQTMSIWPVFGSANQLLAALALLALTVWVANLKRDICSYLSL